MITLKHLWLFTIIIIAFSSSLTLSNTTINTAKKTVVNIRSQARDEYIENGEKYILNIIEIAYPSTEFEINFKTCPWKRCIKEVMNGEADILLGIYDNEVFLGDMMSTNKYPFAISQIGVAFKKSNWPNWNGLDSVTNQHIVMMRGYDLHKEIKIPVKLLEVSSFEQEWKLLISGRTEYILDGINALNKLRVIYAPHEEDIRIEPIFEKFSYLGVSTTPKAKELIKIFDNKIIELYKSGEIINLQKKWRIKKIPDLKTLQDNEH